MAAMPESSRPANRAVLTFVPIALLSCLCWADEPLLDYDLSAGMHELQTLESAATHGPPNPDRCRCLARDGKHLWVGTTAGAVRWSLGNGAPKLFKVHDYWNLEFALKVGLPRTDRYEPYDKARSRAYMKEWARNAVEDIVVLSPGNVWVETFNGVMVIRGESKQVFASKEQALAALHQTDLRPSLAKIVVMDKQEHLWRTHVIERVARSDFLIRRFDGRKWATMPQPGKSRSYGSNIERIFANANGDLWACGRGGIYRRQADQWERQNLKRRGAVGVSCRALYFGPSGTLWAFDMGWLGRFDREGWRTYHGQGRYSHFMLDSSYRRPRRQILRAWEAADGKLWFGTTELGLMCFDGKTFRATPGITAITAITTGPGGRTFVSTGQRIFRYDRGKWRGVPAPKTRWFQVVGPEVLAIEDLLAVDDNTLYLASPRGLWKRQDGKWQEVRFAKEPGSGSPALPGAPPHMSEEIQKLMQGILTPIVLDQNYKAYVEGPGRKLVKATDDQLADDVESGSNQMSALISYHRLQSRDAARAGKSLEKRIRTTMKRGENGESWIVQLQLAAYGPSAIKPLLKLAREGQGRQSPLAVGALGALQDKKVVKELLKLAKDGQTDNVTYLAIISAALWVGNPEGMDMLVKVATMDAAPPGPSPDSRPTVFGPYDLREKARDLLRESTRQYDDLPDDWSRLRWRNWWRKHRDTWKPAGVPRGLLPPVSVVGMSDKIAKEIAKRLEAKAKPAKHPAAK